MPDQHTIGRYTVVRRLAFGGMAEVLLCHAHEPGGELRQVVIKRVLPAKRDDPRWVNLLVDEARLAMRLTHPNLVRVLGLEQDEAGPFMVMEYIQGLDLVQLINASAQRGLLIPFELAALIVSEVAEGLHSAHQLTGPDGTTLGLVHRDVSPANVIVTRDGAIKVVDFGVAKHKTQTQHTQQGELKGKLSYMSPEQARGAEIDLRSDVYSLGVVLYELLTGVSCFKRATQPETLAAVAAGRYRPASDYRADIPVGLARILSRMLAYEPAKRYQSARAISERLGAFMHATARPDAAELVTFLRAVAADPNVPVSRARTATALTSEEELQPPGLDAELAEPGARPWLPRRASPELVAAVFPEEEPSGISAFDDSDAPRTRFRPRIPGEQRTVRAGKQTGGRGRGKKDDGR